MPFETTAKTQETKTETTETSDKVTQTKDHNEPAQQGGALPYEIHIQTSFIIPEEMSKNVIEPPSSEKELEKSFVIDESQPGFVVETMSKEKVKKSKKKKKNKNSGNVEKIDAPEDTAVKKQDLSVQKTPTETDIELLESQHQPTKAEPKPTLVTLNITKTTVYETSNVVSRERLAQGPSVSIEEVTSEEPQGMYIYSQLFVMLTFN